MADKVENVTHEILRGIQASIAELRASTEAKMDELRRDVGRQFEMFAEEARSDRRKINGLMAIVQSVSGDFDERIRGLGDRVSILEDHAT
jgi:hypothetical protein